MVPLLAVQLFEIGQKVALLFLTFLVVGFWFEFNFAVLAFELEALGDLKVLLLKL